MRYLLVGFLTFLGFGILYRTVLELAETSYHWTHSIAFICGTAATMVCDYLLTRLRK